MSCLFKLTRGASYHLGRIWYTCWCNVRTISGTASFDLEFDLDGEMSGQRPWLCNVLREASYRLRPFWYTCRHNFGTISDTPPFDLELDLEGQVPGRQMPIQVKYHRFLNCPMKLAVVCDHFGKHADVISGQYPVPRPMTLNLTSKVKCQVKGHGCVNVPGRVAIVWNHFSTLLTQIRDDIRYPIFSPSIWLWRPNASSKVIVFVSFVRS